MDGMISSRNPSLVPGPENSSNYNFHYYDYYSGIELNDPMMEKSTRGYSEMGKSEKKRRLTNEQIETLENSFAEDQKLEPERKSKLAQELGLQARQVAIWFQNRRARWKAKEMERSYDVLKFEYGVVLKEKKRLQEEVLALKKILREGATMNYQVSSGQTEMSGEETTESTSIATWRNISWPELPYL